MDWFVQKYEGGGVAIHSDTDNRVCFMASAGQCGSTQKQLDEYADLISAAPNLKQALQDLLAEAEEAGVECPETVAAREALAKAEGSQREE